MYRTIIVGEYIAIQGRFVRDLENGHIVIRVGEAEYAGPPVTGRAA